ncbi:type II toxin-antitoxin system antitoxin SocA domain-containing protein [Pseudoramibacter porci]|uniref:DUF4065 domain-containing protein n=1 Tax=Pseudoramibacter porci TaxID=2606631 RepID=A0A7X2T904_9FIRM|nr:type II toxin-antitoxin system antitoxin SocA domain-containing protein [Pseudoramibacter porci]MSS18862.1 DUF4065 domain-containing protein [Pseudoramibacter porci]
MNNRKYTFCSFCENEVSYSLQKKTVKRTIRGKDYQFVITEAYCDKCGCQVTPRGLIDQNVREIDTQYRKEEGIVSVDDIQKLSDVYNIGKEPLSLALGFGKVTISRYLDGQVPSKEYSDVIRRALASPSYMKEMLQAHKESISQIAFEKSERAINNLMLTAKVPEKTRNVITCIFEKLEEITPLSLQKLLYFVQGISLATTGLAIIEEDCEAWIHGPVFPDVYNLFKNFKYNPIDDERFPYVKWSDGQLNDVEKQIIDLVAKTFGQYSGKALEGITHKEIPWINARRGYASDERSNEIISKEQIKQYFLQVYDNFDMLSVEGINHYIAHMRKSA